MHRKQLEQEPAAEGPRKISREQGVGEARRKEGQRQEVSLPSAARNIETRK
jgi:hypothetical protein